MSWWWFRSHFIVTLDEISFAGKRNFSDPENGGELNGESYRMKMNSPSFYYSIFLESVLVFKASIIRYRKYIWAL